MIILSQRDARWSAEKIGKSLITIGRYGCTLTCLSMLSSYFGGYRTPAALARGLSFTSGGLIIWSSMPKLLPFKLEKRLYSRNDDEIMKSLKDAKRAVILQVDGFHWVVALSKIPFTKHYRIGDPWTGKKSTTLSYKAITGSAHVLAI
jgi:ABC-type bacteriocin/lantibiotic exporter with double-glycine peptidase domain